MKKQKSDAVAKKTQDKTKKKKKLSEALRKNLLRRKAVDLKSSRVLI